MIIAGSAMADQASSTLDDRLMLRVMIDDEISEIPLCHGLKLGTDATNVDIFLRPIGAIRRNYLTAVVRDDDGFLTLFSFDNQVAIVLPNGRETMFLRLQHGTKFKIGVIEFECIVPGLESPKIDLETPKMDSSEPIESDEPFVRHSCPRCREHIGDCGDARFCPHCGVPLPDDCPAWPIVAPMPRKVLRASRLRWLLPRFLYRYRVDDPLYSSRRTSVLAYINTLFNLGLRLEAGANDNHNPREAERYYEKAASMGNLPGGFGCAEEETDMSGYSWLL